MLRGECIEHVDMQGCGYKIVMRVKAKMTRWLQQQVLCFLVWIPKSGLEKKGKHFLRLPQGQKWAWKNKRMMGSFNQEGVIMVGTRINVSTTLTTEQRDFLTKYAEETRCDNTTERI